MAIWKNFFEPFMFERQRTGIPFRFVDVEQAGDKIFGARPDVLKFCIIEGKLATLNLFVDFSVIRAMERQIAAQNNVHNDAQTPAVTFFAVIAVKHLRRQIVRSTNQSLEFIALAILTRDVLAQAEVNYLDPVVQARVHDVLGLKIAMRDPLAMQVIDRHEE